jgi:ABC-type nitrate/sulfonate/bicarbonate transport system substrate-binding protein
MINVVNMLHTAEFVAVEKGFFLKQGLNVKFVHTQTGAEANAAMESGSAQLTDSGVTSIPPARAAGLPLVMFVPTLNDATTNVGDNALAVVARTDSGIKPNDAKSLIGKTVGLVRGGTGDEYLTDWLRKEGVDPKQVRFLNVQPGDQLVTIQSKNVDAIATWEPFQTLILETMGSQAVLIKRGGPILGYILGIGTTDSYMRSHPEVIQAATDALAEAEAWTRANQDAAADVATHWIPGLPSKVARDAIRHINFDPRISGCTVRAFTESTKILFDQHKIKNLVPASEQLSDRFVKQTEDRHPELFKDLAPIPAFCSR